MFIFNFCTCSQSFLEKVVYKLDKCIVYLDSQTNLACKSHKKKHYSVKLFTKHQLVY